MSCFPGQYCSELVKLRTVGSPLCRHDLRPLSTALTPPWRVPVDGNIRQCLWRSWCLFFSRSSFLSMTTGERGGLDGDWLGLDSVSRCLRTTTCRCFRRRCHVWSCPFPSLLSPTCLSYRSYRRYPLLRGLGGVKKEKNLTVNETSLVVPPQRF